MFILFYTMTPKQRNLFQQSSKSFFHKPTFSYFYFNPPALAVALPWKKLRCEVTDVKISNPAKADIIEFTFLYYNLFLAIKCKDSWLPVRLESDASQIYSTALLFRVYLTQFIWMYTIPGYNVATKKKTTNKNVYWYLNSITKPYFLPQPMLTNVGAQYVPTYRFC